MKTIPKRLARQDFASLKQAGHLVIKRAELFPFLITLHLNSLWPVRFSLLLPEGNSCKDYCYLNFVEQVYLSNKARGGFKTRSNLYDRTFLRK